jgi:predicted phage terminase large subunit-like protein
VHLPENAPWLGEFLTELLAFPKGRHDDQVDSVSQFLKWAAVRRFREQDLVISLPIISFDEPDLSPFDRLGPW